MVELNMSCHILIKNNHSHSSCICIFICFCITSRTHPCDGRRSVTELKLEYGDKIDYQYMENDDDVYGQKLGESR